MGKLQMIEVSGYAILILLGLCSEETKLSQIKVETGIPNYTPESVRNFWKGLVVDQFSN